MPAQRAEDPDTPSDTLRSGLYPSPLVVIPLVVPFLEARENVAPSLDGTQQPKGVIIEV